MSNSILYYPTIHSLKMDVKLLQNIFYEMKQIDEDQNWLYAHPNAVNFYMTFLANHIAKKNGLDLWTRNQEVWTTSTYFLYDGDIQDMYYGSDSVYSSREALASIMIPDVFPQNILDIPPESILKFRETRSDERAQFMDAVNHLREKLSNADAPEVVQEIIHDEKKKVDDAIHNYKKSMDLLRIAKFGGALTTVLTLTADALGYCNDIPDVYMNAVASSGIWIDILTGLAEKKTGNTQNPYTYLAHMKSEFSYFPNSSSVCAEFPPLAKYNYTLSRGFEEFVCD